MLRRAAAGALLAALCLVTLRIACSTGSPRRETNASALTTVGDRANQTNGSPLPPFAVVAESTYDIPAKTQIERHIVVDTSVTPQSARALLEAQHSELSARRGFRFHDSPTNVYIYLYATRAHAAAGEGLWLAMLDRSFGEVTPNIHVKEEAIADLHRPKVVKFGLSEAERIAVYQAIVTAEDSTDKAAQMRYPDPVRGSRAAYLANLRRQGEYREQLLDRAKRQLARRYGLTRAQLDSLTSEGMQRQWPMPPLR
jgi:hypothetical protein